MPSSLALLLCLFIVDTSSHSLTSRFRILIPGNLRYWNHHDDHRQALFGTPYAQGSILANVVYVHSDLCSFDAIRTSPHYPSQPRTGGGGGGGHNVVPFIMMLNRGNCTYVTKVRNAQHSGAAGVLIADTNCLCSDSACMDHRHETDRCEERDPAISDDGSGSDVTIPSFHLYKMDADPLKEELLKGNKVQVEMSWHNNYNSSTVDFSLWSIPTDVVSKEFFSDFKDVAIKLGKEFIDFTLHMYIVDGQDAGCRRNGHDSQKCGYLCTNEGRYCAPDVVDYSATSPGISGAEVVRESLRRLCIWNVYGKNSTVGNTQPWWDYITLFNDHCYTMRNFANSDCINDAMRRAGVDLERIKQCVTMSGGLDGNIPNALLDGEIRARHDQGIVFVPTATVNRVPVRSELTVANIFGAICNEYHWKIPKICHQCAGCSDIISCVTNNGHCVAVNISSIQPGNSLDDSTRF
uniref:PA domain-containing protein n=1 Tax=Cyclophora tenuis TaxID=216820 RepID=A0A7S1D551_CYCTE